MFQPPIKGRNVEIERPKHHRLTVAGQVYHQVLDQNPQSVPIALTRNVKSDEQVYSRNIRVGDTWKPIDRGWFTLADPEKGVEENKIGLIVIGNDEGRGFHVQPTEEERKLALSRVVLVGYFIEGVGTFPVLKIRPGECWPIDPFDFSALRLRCQPEGQSAKCKIYLYPE